MKHRIIAFMLKASSAAVMFMAVFAANVSCCECIWYQPEVPKGLMWAED